MRLLALSVLASLLLVAPSARAAPPAPPCGNGTVDAAEDCDDGNTSDGDGCSARCNTEEGFTCDNAGATNLLVNGGFENGSTGWTSSAVVRTNGTGAQDGEVAVVAVPNNYVTTRCVSGSCLDGNAGGLVWAQTITVEPSTTYYFTAFVAVRTDGTNGNATSKLVLRKAGANIAATFTGDGPPPAPWRTYGSQFATDSEQTSIQVEIYNDYLGGAGNGFVLDEIAVVKKPSVCTLASEEIDAGPTDEPDAGPTEEADAGMTAGTDAGDEEPMEPTGCGCGAGNAGALALPLAALLRRRRVVRG